MRLDDLIDELHAKGVMRPTIADPRKPPILEIGNPSKGDDEQDIDVYELPLDRILEPIKARDDGESYDDVDDSRDWLEESDCYPIIYSDANNPLGGWERDGTEPYIDCWAWYCPFHFYEEEYGIYIRGDKLQELSRSILSMTTFIERKKLRSLSGVIRRLFGEQLKQAALLHLFMHEMYHHKVEAFATRLEVVGGVPKFVPYFDSVCFPLSHPLSDDLVEEGLANANAIRRIKNDQRYLKRQFPKLTNCPNVGVIWRRFEFYSNQTCFVPGYSRVKRYILPNSVFSEDNFVADQRLLQQSIIQASSRPLGDPRQWAFAPGMLAPFWNKDIIAYEVVYPGARSSLAPSGASKSVQGSPRKVIRAARKWGIKKSREAKGDHTIYSSRSGNQVSIDNGYNDLPSACWEGLFNIINAEYGLSLNNNQAGRRRFLAGPPGR